MADPIARYIRENRMAFDDEQPGPEVWKGISREMGWERSLRPTYYALLWKAAAVFFLFLSIWLIIDRFADRDDATVSDEYQLSSEVSEVEMYYTALIGERKQELQLLAHGHEALWREFIAELDGLDSMYNLLKKQMVSGNETEIAASMALNLQMRIDLLNWQLNVLQNIKKAEGYEGYNL